MLEDEYREGMCVVCVTSLPLSVSMNSDESLEKCQILLLSAITAAATPASDFSKYLMRS